MTTAMSTDTMWAHQRMGVELAKENPRYAFFWDTGVGKTRTVCEILKRRWDWGERGPTLIVAPVNVATLVWPREINRWYPDSVIIDGMGSRSKRKHARKALLEYEDSDAVLVTTHDSFRLDAPDWIKLCQKRPLGALIIDESQKIKDPKARRTKALMKFSALAKRVHLLTARPNPESLMDLWSQMFCIDPELLGTRFYSFKGRYFFQPRPESLPWLWQAKKKELHGVDAKEEILKAIGPHASSLSKSEVQKDLPEKVHLIRGVQLNKAERAAYEEFVKNYYIRVGDGEVLASTALVEYMKVRQILAGIVRDIEGTWHRLGDSKAKACLEIIREEIPGEQCLVACEYIWEIDYLSKLLKKEGLSVDVLRGKTKRADKEAMQDRWDAGKTQIIVAQTRTVASGLNLQHAHNMIWSTLSSSGDDMYQTESRFHRGGQTHTCRVFHLVTEDTSEAKLLAKMQNKETVTLDFLERLK